MTTRTFPPGVVLTLLAAFALSTTACPKGVVVDDPFAITAPVDAMVDVELRSISEAQAVLKRLFSIVDVDGGLMFGVQSKLFDPFLVHPLAAGTPALAGLSSSRPAFLFVRPVGGVVMDLPVDDGNRAVDAVALALGGAVSAHGTGALKITQGSQTLAILVVDRARLRLVLSPVDAVAELAVLQSLVGTGRPVRRARSPGAIRVVVDAAAFADVTEMSGLSFTEPLAASIDHTDAGLKIRIDVAPFVDTVTPSPFSCAALDDAILEARIPARVLASLLGDTDRLRGDVDVLLVNAPALRDDGDFLSALSVVLVGVPRDLAALSSLRASFGVDENALDDEVHLVAPADGDVAHTMAAQFTPARVLIASGGTPTLDRAGVAAPCARPAKMFALNGRKAMDALVRPPDVSSTNAGPALRRLIGRSLRSVDEVSAHRQTLDGVSHVEIDVHLR